MNRLRTGRLKAAIAGCALSLIPGGISYAEPDKLPLDSGMSGSNSSVFWMMFKVFAFLVILIGLFLIVIRLLAKKNKNLMSGRSVKALGGLPLGTNKSVQVIQIGHSLYVLGVGNDIRLLDKIDDPEEIRFIGDYLHPNGPRASAAFSSVGDWIDRLKRKERNEEAELASSFQDVFYEKMQRLSNRQKKVEDLLLDENYADRLTDKDE